MRFSLEKPKIKSMMYLPIAPLYYINCYKLRYYYCIHIFSSHALLYYYSHIIDRAPFFFSC